MTSRTNYIWELFYALLKKFYFYIVLFFNLLETIEEEKENFGKVNIRTIFFLSSCLEVVEQNNSKINFKVWFGLITWNGG